MQAIRQIGIGIAMLLACGLCAADWAAQQTEMLAFNLEPTRESDIDFLDRKGASFIPHYQEAWKHEIERHYTNPTHEQITCLAQNDCGRYEDGFQTYVRWNDAPPFKVTSDLSHICSYGKYGTLISLLSAPPIRADCFTIFIVDGVLHAGDKLKLPWDKFRAVRYQHVGIAYGWRDALLYRVHFGDLQFLHSMASKNGESAESVRAHIYQWAQFSYYVATQRVRLDTLLRDVDLTPAMDSNHVPPDFPTLFPTFKFGKDNNWRVRDLFWVGGQRVKGQNISEDEIRRYAFGSLLHMVQDSYAAGHVCRAPFGPNAEIDGDGCALGFSKGAVISFHNYVGQNSTKHGVDDDWDLSNCKLVASTEDVHEPINATRKLIEIYQQLGNNPGDHGWAEIQVLLDEIYKFDATATVAKTISGPGKRYIPGGSEIYSAAPSDKSCPLANAPASVPASGASAGAG